MPRGTRNGFRCTFGSQWRIVQHLYSPEKSEHASCWIHFNLQPKCLFLCCLDSPFAFCKSTRKMFGILMSDVGRLASKTARISTIVSCVLFRNRSSPRKLQGVYFR